MKQKQNKNDKSIFYIIKKISDNIFYIFSRKEKLISKKKYKFYKKYQNIVMEIYI